MTKAIPTRHCDECNHYNLIFGTKHSDKDKGCENGHKPRFYAPRSPVDLDWGHKRKCIDFVPKPEYANQNNTEKKNAAE